MYTQSEDEIAASFVGQIVLTLIRNNQSCRVTELVTRISEVKTDTRAIVRAATPFTRMAG